MVTLGEVFNFEIKHKDELKTLDKQRDADIRRIKNHHSELEKRDIAKRNAEYENAVSELKAKYREMLSKI